MKKGCFFSFLVFLTLAVGVCVYISKYHKDIIKNFARDRIVNLAHDELSEKLEKTEKSPYKDSLRTEINRFFREHKDLPFDSMKYNFSRVIEKTKIIIDDNKVDSAEYFQLKKLLINYERPEKSRN